MRYLSPFVVYGATALAGAAEVRPHAESYVKVLEALRDGRIDQDRAEKADCLRSDLAAGFIREEAAHE
jgi:hypothetical protein